MEKPLSDQRKQQIIHEIKWLENKLKTVKKEKHRNDLQRQITEREYNLELGIQRPHPST